MAKKKTKAKKRSHASDGVSLPTKKIVEKPDLAKSITMWYGPPGVGKTTFVHEMFPDALFFSTDRGTRHLKGAHYPAVDVNSWDDITKTIRALRKARGGPYSTYVIDHTDDVYLFAERWQCDRLNVDGPDEAGYGKGWKKVRELFTMFIQELLSFDKGLVFICHERVKTVKTRSLEVDRTEPSLGKTAWKVVVPLAEIIGYIHMDHKKVKVKGGKTKRVERRVVTTQPERELYVKDRTGRCPSVMELDGKQFLKHYMESK